ncbi:response regulator [Clostridium septicum]|uniref:Stage 0 sporulation protein A homolog n=1 Tax=Clostridium septicum TaxID=1504 RepID=A0A9N7JP26_CLOSE|nr:response regulator [Clostridium septicum]AYE35376.1 response regulator [Clostridium septicum]MDU1315238.1 response regulator [Clostridium septicum]QAS60766.1 response regulator [Clostridium septicum]UEC19969.1 response regulator [Clostridium septicum]USS01972.1 response regulator [Clostridium septicum]
MYTVLHIEQSEFFLKIVESEVLEKGYEYISTENFNEANSILRENHIDLIITSLYAKGGKIEEFVKDVNSKYNIPIFVVTSNDIDEHSRKIINLGISEYILKKDMKEEIRKHLDNIFREDEYMECLKEVSIAVLEDNKLERIIEKKLLEDYGIKNVDYYMSGELLLNSNKKYDIYLIDIILKNEFGKDIIRKIRRNNIDASIIAVTGLDNEKTLANLLNTGANDFITKPVNEDMFIAKLKSNVRVYNLEKKLKELKKTNKN